MKRRSKCGETKPLDAFHKQKRLKDGRYGYCKECRRTYRIADWNKNLTARRATLRRIQLRRYVGYNCDVTTT